MGQFIEVDEAGELRLPGSLLPDATPGARYTIISDGNQLILSLNSKTIPFYLRATPEERAADIVRFAKRNPDGPGLADEAVGRDSIYD